MSRIYLVDDHPIVRGGLGAMLEASGHEVVGEAGEPTLAISEIVRLQPDLLLLDLNLNDRSGFELLAEIRRRNLSVRSIVVTMSAQPRHVAEALQLGAAGYVLKGSGREELLNAIQEVSNGRRHLGSEVAELAVEGLTTESDGSLISTLSPRERQIITMVAKGQSSPVIGQKLHLSPKTVDTYRSRLMSKIGVSDVTGLVRFAIRTGLIDANDD